MSLICSLVFGSRGCPRLGLRHRNMVRRRTSSCAHRSCQQEVEAVHPVPARGRGKRNAGGSGMPAGSGSCPSSASSGAVEAKCQQEAESVQAGKMVLKTEALVLSDQGGAQGWACATGRPPRGDEGPFMPAGSGSRPSSASSGAVEAECQQEAEATHPATARGRWKRNASRKRKPPIQRQLGGSGSRMPA